MDTNIIGTVTELKSEIRLMELGYIVSQPLTPVRYDYIIDTGTNLYKVQSKACHLEGDGEKIVFSTCSSHYVNGQHTHNNYKDDGIDFFSTFYNGECYLIPVSECGKREKCLRLQPTKNGQIKNISFAKDYLAQEVLSK